MNISSTLTRFGSSLVLGMALVAGSSAAHAESEPNDTFANADAAGPGSFSGVIGDLTGVSNDVDIWKFDLTAGSGMGASITNGAATDFNGFDPIIVLFMEAGGDYYPVAANNPNLFSTSFGFTPWVSGTYYLTVSAFGNSPQDFFNNQQYDSAFWSDEFFGLGTSFDHFEGNSFSSFDYNLSLSGTVAAPVPVPAALWLFGSGLVGLGAAARRRRLA